MKKYHAILIIALLVILGLYFLIPKRTPTVTVNSHIFQIEIADTEETRSTGLSNRDHLDEESGMLFVFPDSDIHSFWMKDTKIPLDIIWLAPSEVEGISDPSTELRTGKIVEMISLGAATSDTIPQYTPKEKSNYTLELNTGAIQKYDFKIGDLVKIDKY